MADYKNSIMLGVNLESKDSLNGKLQSLIKNLNDTKINLDINIKNSDVARQLETLTTLANNFKNSLGGNINLGNINEIINQATTAMSNLNGEVLKVTTTRFNNGEIGKQVAEISTGIGTVVKQVQSLQDGTLIETGKTITTNNAKIKQSIDDISNAMQKLNQLEQNGFVDQNKLADLKNMLGNTENFSSDNELKKYLEQVKQLEVEETKLIQIQKEELDLVNAMANGREKAELKTQQNDRTSELKQAQAINKALEDEYKLQQQIKNSETNSLTKDINSAITQVEKLQNKFGQKLPNGFVESTISDLNKMITELKEADNVNFNGMRNNLNSVKSSIEQVTNETKQMNSANNNSNGFFGSMSNFLGKIGVFYGIQQVVQEISQQFKNAGEYTLTLDKNISAIQMITGKTKDEVVGITQQFKNLGAQLHITNQEMLAGSEELMRAGYDNGTTSKMLEASSMASKISGQTTQATTEQLIAIKNAFDMTGDQMQHVIDVISKLDNTSATSFKEISSAIMRTAFSAQQAGTSFDTLSAYVTTVSEKTRRSAETIGEAFKTIYSRYYNIKLGNVDEEGKTINDVETAMNRLGISIRSSKGEFKDFDVVLNEFVQKYKEGQLSQVDFLTGINTLGGTRQKETLLALVENFDQVKKHMNDVTTSTGSAKQMYDVYSNSLEAKVADLKRAFEGLYEKILSSDSLKWLITEFTQLITALSNLDGQTIAFTASIGGLVLVMSKLSALNKTLIAGEAVSGLSSFIAVLTKMKTVKTDIEGVTNATKAMQIAQLELNATEVAGTVGATGLSGAFQLLKNGIIGATESAIAFMTTPLGLIISGIAVAIGIAVTAFTSYKQHQAELTQQSKDLKNALEGVNEALKNGDTSKAQEDVDKMKKAQEQLQRLIEIKKKYQDMPSTSFNPTAGGANQADLIAGVNKKIEEQEKVLKDAGYTVDEYSGKVKELSESQDKIDNTKIINSIKEQTKAQLENRQNMEQAQTEFNNYIGSIQSLYAEYQNLSAQESLSAEQKSQLGNVVEQLQEKVGGLNVSIDENGKAYISNSPLIEANIQRLQTEGLTVDNLSAIRITDAKVNSEWQIGNSQVTYAEITNRIGMYKAEIQAIQAVIQARMAGAQDYSTMSIGKAQSMEENSPEFEQLKQQQDQLHAYENAKQQADVLYAGIGSVPYSGGNGGNIPSTSTGDYMPSGGDAKKKKGEDEAKKAHDEAVKAEKEALKKITDAYDDAKEAINDDLKDIELNEKSLGKASNDNFPQRVDFANQKIKEQQSLLDSATNQLMSLETQSYSTEEGQQALADAIKKANTEIKSQKIVVEETRQSLQDLLQEQEKQVLEQEKNVAETKLSSKQAYDNYLLEQRTKKEETLHNNKMDYYDKELEELEKQNDTEEKSNELQEKKNDLKQKEIDLQRLKDQGDIQVYTKDSNGNWNFTYTYDKKAVESKQKEVEDAKKSLADTRRKQEYDEEKANIESQKKSEEELYKKKEEYLKQYSDTLKEQQDLEKQRLDNYYSDMEKLAKDRLASLEGQYGDNWDAIAKVIQTKLTETQNTFEQLTEIKLNFGEKAIQEALDSKGGLTNYLISKRNEIDKSVSLNLNEIDSNIKSIDNSAKSLSDTYDDILDKQNKNAITDDDIDTRKKQTGEMVSIDYDGLSKQLDNLKDTNAKIKSELDSFYNDKLNKQNSAQQNELNSLKKFTETYLSISDKFLELLQIVYDFRFNNMSTIVSGFVQNMLEALVQMENDYEKFAQMWNKVHPTDKIPSSIDISDNISGTVNYQKSTMDYQTGKLDLYSADAFEQYIKQINGGIGNSLLSKLNNYSSSNGVISNTNSSSIVNNKNNSSTSNTTNVNINQLDVNTKDAQNLLNQLLTLVNSKTKLS